MPSWILGVTSCVIEVLEVVARQIASVFARCCLLRDLVSPRLADTSVRLALLSSGEVIPLRASRVGTQSALKQRPKHYRLSRYLQPRTQQHKAYDEPYAVRRQLRQGQLVICQQIKYQFGQRKSQADVKVVHVHWSLGAFRRLLNLPVIVLLSHSPITGRYETLLTTFPVHSSQLGVSLEDELLDDEVWWSPPLSLALELALLSSILVSGKSCNAGGIIIVIGSTDITPSSSSSLPWLPRGSLSSLNESILPEIDV
ncbi:hypothetical protein SLEP1_g6835 [Rubroshorea leprosula]|uniref:Uncharacterized protein n=1 Tax=Rubroshorea leprosula TaxID=152421 RepID=A0AAV5HWU6_9ROSI|nr:hypothetical protein SLEP1_g6835 [Rubroshorea leprosula]